MASKTTNIFTTFALTDRETLQGQILSLPQKMFIQNERARLAEEKLVLEFDPEHPLLFQQAESYKRGQLEILTYLLELSDAAETLYANQPTESEE